MTCSTASASFRHRGSGAFGPLVVLLGLSLGCRHEVLLEDPDAGLGTDTQPTPDAGLDAFSEDDAPDAPPPSCETGLPLLAAQVSEPGLAPTFGGAWAGTERRYAILVPPAARADSGTQSLLWVINARGERVASRELDLTELLGTPTSTATLHPMPMGQGYLVLEPHAVWLLDPEGSAVGDPVPLPEPPLAGMQRHAGWIDEDRFVFASSSVGAPLMVFDRASRLLTTTPIDVADAAAVWVHGGGVTVGRDDALGMGLAETVEYAPSLNGDIVYRSTWPEGPLTQRLLGASTTGGVRRWLVADGAEFRNEFAVYDVPDTGTPVRTASLLLVAPITSFVSFDFATLRSSAEPLAAFDFDDGAFRTLSPSSSSALCLAERDGAGGYAVISIEPGAASNLEFRCVP